MLNIILDLSYTIGLQAEIHCMALVVGIHTLYINCLRIIFIILLAPTVSG